MSEQETRTRDHPLLTAFIDTLPPPGRVWEEAEMVRWLRALEESLKVVYRVRTPRTVDSEVGGEPAG